MGFLVGFAGCRVRESLVAVPTAERLLPGVNTHMSLEVSSVGEFLPTILQRRKCAVRNEARKPFKAKSVCVTMIHKIHIELPSPPRFSYQHHLCFIHSTFVFDANILALLPVQKADATDPQCVWCFLLLFSQR